MMISTRVQKKFPYFIFCKNDKFLDLGVDSKYPKIVRIFHFCVEKNTNYFELNLFRSIDQVVVNM